MLREKIVKTIVVGYVELIPIVEPRAPQLPVVYLKAERADEMQRSTGRRACAGDVAGVLRYLRLYKNNINVRQDNNTSETTLSSNMEQSSPDRIAEAFRNKKRIERTRKQLCNQRRVHRAVDTRAEIAQTERQHPAQRAVDESCG